MHHPLDHIPQLHDRAPSTPTVEKNKPTGAPETVANLAQATQLLPNRKLNVPSRRLGNCFVESVGSILTTSTLTYELFGQGAPEEMVTRIIAAHEKGTSSILRDTLGDTRLFRGTKVHFGPYYDGTPYTEKKRTELITVYAATAAENDSPVFDTDTDREYAENYDWSEVVFGEPSAALKEIRQTNARKGLDYLLERQGTVVPWHQIDRALSDRERSRSFSGSIKGAAIQSLQTALDQSKADLWIADLKVDRPRNGMYVKELRDGNGYLAYHRNEYPDGIELPTGGTMRGVTVRYENWRKFGEQEQSDQTNEPSEPAPSTTRPTPNTMPQRDTPLRWVEVDEHLGGEVPPAEEQTEFEPSTSIEAKKIVRQRKTLGHKAIDYCMAREGQPIAWFDLNPHVFSGSHRKKPGSVSNYVSAAIAGKLRSIPAALDNHSAELLVAKVYVEGRKRSSNGNAYMTVNRERFENGDYELPEVGELGKNKERAVFAKWSRVVFVPGERGGRYEELSDVA